MLDLYEQALEENLRDWFKEKWVRFGPDGKIRGDCARGDDSEGKPKCLPQKKAHALGKKGRASAARRKRREDPNPERRGKAINVATKKKTNEEQIEELKCWDGYRRVPGKRPGSPGSCTKATAESMDGVSPGTHMFTSEENAPARRGSVSTFGPAGRVGILNKERILKAASFVTKQANHPQNQAKLYVPDSGSPKGVREVALLNTADTKILAKFLQAFFRNPELNRVHKWLYDFMSHPAKLQALATQLQTNPQYTEIVSKVTDPAHIKAIIGALDKLGGLGEAINPANQQSVTKTKRVFMVVDKINDKQKFRFDDETQARSAVRALNRDSGYERYAVKSMNWPTSSNPYYESEQLEEKWSEKYKRSINCSNPKGFSQRAHCQGRKKK